MATLLSARLARELAVAALSMLVGFSCGRPPLRTGSKPPTDACEPAGDPGSITRVANLGSEGPSIMGHLGPCQLLFTPGTRTWLGPLWITDGSAEGTRHVVDDFPIGSVSFLLGRVAILSSLGRTDGTAAGSFRLHDQLQTTTYGLTDGAVLGDLLVFAGREGLAVTDERAHGYELWRTDGSREGTFMLADLVPGPEPRYSGPSGFVALGGVALFGTGDGLWRTDGTAAGTLKLAAVRKRESTVLGDELLFVGEDDQSGFGLWRTDGTAEGTLLLQVLGIPVQGGASFYGWRDGFGMATLDQRIVLLASSAAPVRRDNGDPIPRLGPPIDAVWVTDGSASGTRLVVELPQVQEQATPPAPVAMGGFVFFISSANGKGPDSRMHWRTDGTMTGTIPLGPIDGGPFGATVVGSQVFFSAQTSESGAEMWRTDGTAAGSGLVRDINPGPSNSVGVSGGPLFAASAGGRLVFEADDGVHGGELWVTDGTEAGTQMIQDIHVGGGGSALGRPIEMKGAIHFTAASAPGDFGLWRYNPPR